MTISQTVYKQLFDDSAANAGKHVIRVSPTETKSGQPVAVNPKTKAIIWTEIEHERFLTALEMYPTGPWKRIADYVGTKTPRQTMTHAQKYRQKIHRRQRGLKSRARNQVNPTGKTLQLASLPQQIPEQIQNEKLPPPSISTSTSRPPTTFVHVINSYVPAIITTSPHPPIVTSAPPNHSFIKPVATLNRNQPMPPMTSGLDILVQSASALDRVSSTHSGSQSQTKNYFTPKVDTSEQDSHSMKEKQTIDQTKLDIFKNSNLPPLAEILKLGDSKTKQTPNEKEVYDVGK